MDVQWSLVLFAALSAWGAGAYAASVIFGEWLGWAKQVAKPALIVSAAALIVGALASMTHLGHLDRIFGVLSNPASGIFVEGLSAALLVLIIVVILVARARKASPIAIKGVATVGLVPAIVLTVAVGSSYLMPARPAWSVLALPLLSVGTAAVLGCLTVFALNALVGGEVDDASRTRSASGLKKVTMAVLAVQAVLLAAYVVSVGMAPFPDQSRSVERIVAGDLSVLFWGAVVVLGVAVPLAASLTQRRRLDAVDGSEALASSGGVLLAAALVCAVVAAAAFRVVMFSLGSSVIAFGF